MAGYRPCRRIVFRGAVRIEPRRSAPAAHWPRERCCGAGGAGAQPPEATAVEVLVKREALNATAWGLGVTAVLAVLIVVGSRNLDHFDPALVGYTFASLFAAFGITYRYAMWLRRPPTRVYWRRGWRLALSPRHWKGNLLGIPKHLASDIALNGFIWPRGRSRWLAHWLIMWGCILAALI